MLIWQEETELIEIKEKINTIVLSLPTESTSQEFLALDNIQ